MTTDTLAHSADKTAPPKRWRNKWVAKKEGFSTHAGERFGAGDTILGKNVWPSKEVAEQAASRDMASPLWGFEHSFWEYAGAFPVDEQ